MTTRYDLSDLTKTFEAHDVDNSRFGHAEHVKVAFELLTKYDFIDAAAIYAKGIRSIAAKAGASDKFNLTITYAFMSLIAERMDCQQKEGFANFVDGNPDLMRKDILAAWYAPDRLQSVTARRIFLMPDPRKFAGDQATFAHSL